MSLTSELDEPRSPISRYLRERFPNVRDLQRRYREPVADAVPLAPNAAAAVAYPTVGGRSTGGFGSCSPRPPTCTWRS